MQKVESQQSFKIAIVGAPGSGKTTLAARLYARLLERGLYSSRLISEYATEWLGQGNDIDIKSQQHITSEQIAREKYNANCNFSPLICDSGVFLGAIYGEYWMENNWARARWPDHVRSYLEDTYDTIFEYDMVIYVPPFTNSNQENSFRVHTGEMSKKIDHMIRVEIQGLEDTILLRHAPSQLHSRDKFIEEIATEIIGLIGQIDASLVKRAK